MSSKVYFIKASIDEGERVISEKSVRLFKAGGFSDCFAENDFTAVKVHVGEAGNTTYLKSPCIKGLVDELIALKTKPFLTDTSTLYVGKRHNAVDHAILAAEHGFDINGLGIPFIVCDGLFGTSETPVFFSFYYAECVFSHIFLQQFVLGVPVVFHSVESANRYTLGTADALVLVDMGLDVIYSDGIGGAVLETFTTTCAFFADVRLEG